MTLPDDDGWLHLDGGVLDAGVWYPRRRWWHRGRDRRRARAWLRQLVG